MTPIPEKPLASRDMTIWSYHFLQWEYYTFSELRSMVVIRNTSISDCEQEYLHCCFSISENDVILARLCCYLNPYHSIDSEKVLTFGCIEFPDNVAVFSILMDAVVEEARQLGMTSIIGPMDGSTWNTYRIVTSPQPKPFFLEVLTPPFYEKHFRNFGLKKGPISKRF